ncbi:MAG: hypothetical protein K6G55_03010 [Selenomonadaceae bacterium]|nr:hypothetical protein [Selenomonadaceae bacterium]
MKILSREEYINDITDYENFYLLISADNEIFLCADMELTGNDNLRIEMMNFKLNESLNISEAIDECRGKYSGGISFVEYSSFNVVKTAIITDFLALEKNTVYLLCRDDELKKIAESYPNQKIYVRVKN